MKAYIAIALVMTSAPVLAAAAGDNGAAQPKQERMICRRIEALSGSHVSRTRICHTAAQWRAMRDSSVDDQMDALSAINSPNDQPLDGYTSSRGMHEGQALPPH